MSVRAKIFIFSLFIIINLTIETSNIGGSISSKYFFSSHDQENKFNQYYELRELIDLHYMEEGFFKYCTFVQDFVNEQLKSFICEVPRERFIMLVRIFCSNFNYVDGVLTSEVKKHEIWLILEEFTDICNLLCTSSNYDDNEEYNNFNFLDVFISSFEDSNTIIHFPFTVGIVCSNIHWIHYVVNHVFSPRRSIYSHLIKSDINIVWFFGNWKELCSRNDPLYEGNKKEEEESYNNISWLFKSILRLMRIIINN